MPADLPIRSTHADDLEQLERLYALAFPEEDLLGIMRALIESVDGVVSLAALQDNQIEGHIAFSQCSVGDSANSTYLLGPLAVAPAMQRRGIGKALIAAGHERLRALGASHVYVLGDPAYYARSGFTPEVQVAPPYHLPAEWDGAWQSQVLSGAAPAMAGTLKVPPVWDDPALWQP